MAQSRMRRAICFDTAPMIWGVREDANPDDQHMIARTKAYIDHLKENGYAIMVPSPVIAEWFVGATATQFHEMEILKRGFELPDFDARAAVLAAELQRGGAVEEIHQEYGTAKRSIRIDSFIVSIAIIEKAEMIITHNVNEFRRLAGGRIKVEPVPVIQEQQSLEFLSPEDDMP